MVISSVFPKIYPRSCNEVILPIDNIYKTCNIFGLVIVQKDLFTQFYKLYHQMTVPPALLSHESTEHYTPQYLLDAAIASMGAIDLDPCSNSRAIPNVPAARHYTAQDNRLVQPFDELELFQDI